jgi:hypothetical protein
MDNSTEGWSSAHLLLQVFSQIHDDKTFISTAPNALRLETDTTRLQLFTDFFNTFSLHISSSFTI